MLPSSTGTLLLTRRDIQRTLDMAQCIEAVERAFRLHGTGEAAPPSVASVHAPLGGFHIKSGILKVGGRQYFASKTNGNFPGNEARHGLPTIQGTIVVCDAERGTPLAILDSTEVTALRTAAASAVAARHLARSTPARVAIIGCGLQGAMHVDAIALVRQVEHLVLYDAQPDAATRLARRVLDTRPWPVTIVGSAAAAADQADIVITCTTSTEYLLAADDVKVGAFVAGVGVDSERKKELAPSLLARSLLVVDVTGQAAAFGDLHHAIEAGVLSPDAVHAELGQIVAGGRPGRRSDDDIIVFDSTGMALQDVASAAVAYERAVELGLGTRVNFRD